LALRLEGSLAGTATALAPAPAAGAPGSKGGRALARKGAATPARKGAAAPALSVGAPPADPAVFLARLMDLHGSVALGRDLAAIAIAGAAAPRTATAGALPEARSGERAAGKREMQREGAERAVRALVESRIEDLATALCRTFDDPFQRRNKLLGPADVLALVEQSGAGAAGVIWEPFGELATRSLSRIRSDLRALRAEITPGLRALGPEAARLERLDAAISAAIEPGRERVLGEIVPGLSRSFGRSLQEALAELPDGVSPERVATWFGPGGWIRAEIDRIRRVVEAVLAHQARRLLALVEGCAAGELGAQ